MVFGETAQGHSYKDLSHRLSVYFCGHLHRLVAGKDFINGYQEH